MLPARFLPASLAVAAALLAGGAGAAGAEETGADRYEMIIAPPRRDSGGAVPGAEAPAAADAASPSASSAAPTTGAASPATAAPAQGPPRTLQVGAFRQRSSAEHLVESLGGDFGEVRIAEISSGGEPLYRVNVGLLPRGPALDALKKKLAAAGYPSFEVAAPADAPR